VEEALDPPSYGRSSMYLVKRMSGVVPQGNAGDVTT
jgi:hypothetical protein